MRLLPFILSISLPLFGWARFSAGDILALVVTLLLASIAKKVRFQLTFGCLLGSYWIQLYLPIVESGGWVGALCPLLALGSILVATIDREVTFNWESFFRFLVSKPVLLWAIGIPLLLGCGVVVLFISSPLDLPEAFVPLKGLVMGAFFGATWWILSCLVASREDRIAWGHLGATFVIPAILGSLTLFGNVLPTLSKIRSVQATPSGSNRLEVSDWTDILDRTETVGVPLYDRLVRSKALRSNAAQKDPFKWVELAKGSEKDLSEEFAEIGEFWTCLAWGGTPIEKEDLVSSEDSCVGMEIDFPRAILWTLTAKGRLIRLDAEGRKEFQLDPVQTDYIDCAVSPSEPGIFLLENCGRLARFDGETAQTVSEGICDPSRRVFRRLEVDPTTGNLWAMDLYGVLYHSPTEKMWSMDYRFKEVSRRRDIDYDVARDFCISPNGTIALLLCDGEIWTSSRESSEVQGPFRGAHYFPDYAVAQSIDWKDSGYGFVDRYGGFFHSPYPTDRSDSKYRGTYLFPRGVFVDKDEVEDGKGIVDHEYDAEKRWLYLMTTNGRLFTNFKGMGTEAD
jgi:hypothetical protein